MVVKGAYGWRALAAALRNESSADVWWAADAWEEQLHALFDDLSAQSRWHARWPRLRVAFVSAVPEHQAGVSEDRFNDRSGRGPLSCSARVRWRTLRRWFGADGADSQDPPCEAQGSAGCVGLVYQGHVKMLQADLAFWPRTESPAVKTGIDVTSAGYEMEHVSKAAKLLARYDVVIYREFERRLLPALPRVPNQVRLWLSQEPYPYGDSGDLRHREFNVVEPEHLRALGFCPVPLDPFVRRLDALPFWWRFDPPSPQAVAEGLNLAAKERCVVLALTSDVAMGWNRSRLAEGLSALGLQALWDLPRAEYWRALEVCMYVILRPYSRGSNGRVIVEAAVSGITPVFGARNKLYQRLLMPPYLAAQSEEEVLWKIAYLSRHPRADREVRRAIVRRLRFVDSTAVFPATSLIGAVADLSNGDPLCRVPRRRRPKALNVSSESLGTFSHPAVPEQYLSEWLRFRGCKYKRRCVDLQDWIADARVAERQHGDMEHVARVLLQAWRISGDSMIGGMFGSSLMALSHKLLYDRPLVREILRVALEAFGSDPRFAISKMHAKAALSSHDLTMPSLSDDLFKDFECPF